MFLVVLYPSSGIGLERAVSGFRSLMVAWYSSLCVFGLEPAGLRRGWFEGGVVIFDDDEVLHV